MIPLMLATECQAPLDDDALVPRANVSDADLASAKMKLEAVSTTILEKGVESPSP